jgi:integrase
MRYDRSPFPSHMANLYKPRYTKVDSATGERVAVKVRKWYGKYRDADGVDRRVPLCQDKQAAQAMLTDIVRRVERIKAGIVDAVAERLNDPVAKHALEYKTHLEANARSEDYVAETIRKITSIVDQCRLQVLAELQGADDQIGRYLVDRRAEGASYRTVNADLAAIRSFCRWLIKRERIHRDPTATFTPLNVDEDRRLERRALTDLEAAKLIKTTLASDQVYRHLTGQERAHMYMLCQRTGLRRKELRSLTPSSFDFSESPAILTVQAAHSKRRRLDRLPLPEDVATAMQRYLSSKLPGETVWPGAWWRKSAEMLRRDLKAAGIAPKDAGGRVVDFHGQRTTFITGLSRSGVLPAVAQKLARHSDIKLTMDVYTRLEMEELGDAVSRLPKLALTGTTNASPEDRQATPSQQRAELLECWNDLSAGIRSQVIQLIRQAKAGTP